MATDFSLGKQVGPLPLGAWIGIVVGGLGIGYLINQSQNKQVAVPLIDQGVGAGMQQLIETPPINVSPSTPELDNAAWGRNAVNWLVSQNHDQGVADNAVRKYLQAQVLTAQEQAMLNLVLVRFGAPPEPLPPVDQPPTPTPTPSPTPTKVRLGIGWRYRPTNVTKGRPFNVRGFQSKNGVVKGPGVVYVYRRTSDSAPWAYAGITAVYNSGEWSWWGAITKSYYFQFRVYQPDGSAPAVATTTIYAR